MSAARSVGFNKAAVSKLLNLLCDQINKAKYGPTDIYNFDETGLTSLAKSQSKVISLSGKRQVGCLTSAARGQLFTVVLCFSAGGHCDPPYLIFPRQGMKYGLLDDAPPRTVASCHPNGWMQAEIFC
jgi:hypothetical protein